MEPHDGAVRGHVLVNGAAWESVDSSGRFVHNFAGRGGENTLEARLESEKTGGFWRFDFSETSRFVRGSLSIDEGQVFSLGSESVVFRLTGVQGERLRFRFTLRADPVSSRLPHPANLLYWKPIPPPRAPNPGPF